MRSKPLLLHSTLSLVWAKLRYYGWCIALTEDGASPDVRADALVEMAELIASRGDSALAQHQAQEAITLYQRIGKYSQKMTVVRFLETLERKF